MEENRGHVSQRFLFHQRLLNHFWKRWRLEYLHKLSVRNKWQVEHPPVKIGDVVLISDDKVQRGKWPMGRITQVHPGKDGFVRTVTLKTQKGELKRPVQRLHRLEMEQNSLEREQEKTSENVDHLKGDQGGGCLISCPDRATQHPPKGISSITYYLPFEL